MSFSVGGAGAVMQLSLTTLLEYVRQADPDARLDVTTWGQPVLVTSSLRVPTLLVWNPDVSVMTPERRRALEEPAA